MTGQERPDQAERIRRRTPSPEWPTQRQWAAFTGGTDPDDGSWLSLHDGVEWAKDDARALKDGRVAYRAVAYGPWTVLPAEEA